MRRSGDPCTRRASASWSPARRACGDRRRRDNSRSEQLSDERDGRAACARARAVCASGVRLDAGRAATLRMARRRRAFVAHARPGRVNPGKGLLAGSGAAAIAIPDPRSASALRLLSEQVAIPLDQLARLPRRLARGRGGSVQGLEAAGCIEHRRFLIRDHPWFWLSHRGVRLAGTGFPYRVPDVAMLAHRRAVNEIRLHLAERAPQGRWVCERDGVPPARPLRPPARRGL